MGHKHEEVYDKYKAYGEHRPAIGYIERGKLARVYNLDRERGQEHNAGHKREYVYRLREIRSLFTKVKVRKPDSSRARSREVYIVATGRKP